MANIEKFSWTKTKPISIREYASTCGFNLLTIDFLGLSSEHKNWIEKKVIGNILSDFDKKWEEDEWNCPFSQVKKGIYVITMAGTLCIEYPKCPSQVIYIGRGQIRKRINNHLKNWITYFSESLQDISFRFWLTEIKLKGSPDAFKDVESELICRFKKRFGDFPLLNYKHGNTCKRDHVYNVSILTKPFRKEQGIKFGWSIKPMSENQWFKRIED